MSRLIRYQPLSELSPFGQYSMGRARERRPEELTTVSPALDVFHTKDSLVVEASVPGASADDIEISVVGDTLTISGEVKSEEKVEKKEFIFQERRYGRFSRMLTLPDNVDADNATAEFEHGVLRLSFPKLEQSKPKQIKVNVKD